MVVISSPAHIKDQNVWAGNQLNKKLSDGIITWSEMGQQTVQAKEVYYKPLKVYFKVFLAGHTVAMVPFRVTTSFDPPSWIYHLGCYCFLKKSRNNAS